MFHFNDFKDTDPTAHTTSPETLATYCKPPRAADGKVITSLRNRHHFPSAANAPYENDIVVNMDYYNCEHPMARGSAQKKKHWAYLGEIISMNKISRLMLTARDMAGNEILVAFHLECKRREGRTGPSLRTITPDFSVSERGTAVEDGVSMAVGHTIVVAYAELHDFMDLSTGFRIEYDERMNFKVLPYSLKELLEANDTIVNQKLPGFQAKCHYCKKDSEEGLRCGRCQIARYCNKDCQAADWKPNSGSSPSSSSSRGHKFMCKLYREVKWFTDKDWDASPLHNPIQFPRPS